MKTMRSFVVLPFLSMSIHRVPIFSILVLATFAPMLSAQSADTPIFEQTNSATKEGQKEIIKKAQLVREKTSAISKAEIEKQMLDPLPEPIKLPPALDKEMSSEDIAGHARKSNLRVGYCHKCMQCDDWHINLAGGYAIAPNVIVTCDHVVASKSKMRDGFLVACDQDGNVACAVAILARSATMDVAIVKVAGADFTPVPLNSDVKQGSDSYCFSYPLKQQGYFSAGIINRFFWDNTYQGENKDSIDAICHLRMNYSNDWAPGSSGSPLFDSAGNVSGHVSTISSIGSGAGKPAMITLHEGIPARCVQRLVATLQKPGEIKRLAKIKVPETKVSAKQETPKGDKDVP
jgi:hypothetical protein